MSNQADIRIARVYDELDASASARLLVDRVWPRGLRKEDLKHDEWIRDVAPSAALRKWFGHDPDKWDAFRKRYRAELDDNAEAVERCLAWCRQGRVTLLYSATDRERNQAVVLRQYLTELLDREARVPGRLSGGSEEEVSRT